MTSQPLKVMIFHNFFLCLRFEIVPLVETKEIHNVNMEIRIIKKTFGIIIIISFNSFFRKITNADLLR
jgi:hypothetical protein